MNLSGQLRLQRPRRRRRPGVWRRETRRRPELRLGRPRLDALRLSVLALLGVVLAFYVWTADTSSPIRFASGATDKYNLQTDAFLHGQLALLERPAPGLARLPESELGNDQLLAPYFTSDLRDLSLYHGRFYLYWGPGPVLLLYLPWRALGVGDFPEPLAVVVFAFVALLLAVGLLRALVRRFLPGLPRWMPFAGVLTLALADVSPFLLRRPAIYEVAAAAGFCLLFATLLCTVVGALATRPRRGLIALASLFAGLAFASRPPSAVGIVGVLAAVAWLWRRGDLPDRRARVRWALAALVPFLVCVAGQLWFNAARFSGPLDFGQDYQLPVGKLLTNQVSYLGPSLWYYLLLPAHLSFQFPFFFLGPPPRFPGYIPTIYVAEKTGGILPDAPVVLLLAGVPFWLRTRDPRIRRLGVIALGLVAAAAAVLFVIAFRFSGASQRYEMDFLPMLLVAALVSWYALAARWRAAGRRGRVRALNLVSVVLIAISCIVGLGVSITGYYDLLRVNHPQQFSSLERFFSPLPIAAARVLGHPVLAAVNNDPMQPPQRYDRISVAGSSFWQGTSPNTVQVVSPHGQRANFRAVLLRGTRVPPGLPLSITVTSAGGFSQTRPVESREAVFPVRLESGLSDLTFTLSAGASLPFATGDPATSMLARVEHYHLENR